jgi:hypothetical protein
MFSLGKHVDLRWLIIQRNSVGRLWNYFLFLFLVYEIINVYSHVLFLNLITLFWRFITNFLIILDILLIKNFLNQVFAASDTNAFFCFEIIHLFILEIILFHRVLILLVLFINIQKLIFLFIIYNKILLLLVFYFLLIIEKIILMQFIIILNYLLHLIFLTLINIILYFKF